MSILSSLLLLISFLFVVTCVEYTVTPDDGDYQYPNTTCHHCHNLQYYMLNFTKYFTSNTQLLFLPGVYHLHTDLIIQNIYNISLMGTANDITPVSVIQYSVNYDIIAIINSTMITIKNFVFTKYKDVYYSANFKILNCYYIQFHNMVIDVKMKGHNMIGKTNLFNITSSNGLDITYDDNILVEPNIILHKLEIYNYSISKTSNASISIKITQTFYSVYIVITDSVLSQLQNELTVHIKSSCVTNVYYNKILFNKGPFY